MRRTLCQILRKYLLRQDLFSFNVCVCVYVPVNVSACVLAVNMRCWKNVNIMSFCGFAITHPPENEWGSAVGWWVVDDWCGAVGGSAGIVMRNAQTFKHKWFAICQLTECLPHEPLTHALTATHKNSATSQLPGFGVGNVCIWPQDSLKFFTSLFIWELCCLCFPPANSHPRCAALSSCPHHYSGQALLLFCYNCFCHCHYKYTYFIYTCTCVFISCLVCCCHVLTSNGKCLSIVVALHYLHSTWLSAAQSWLVFLFRRSNRFGKRFMRQVQTKVN